MDPSQMSPLEYTTRSSPPGEMTVKKPVSEKSKLIAQTVVPSGRFLESCTYCSPEKFARSCGWRWPHWSDSGPAGRLNFTSPSNELLSSLRKVFPRWKGAMAVSVASAFSRSSAKVASGGENELLGLPPHW